jgi:anti-anti-sigma regulatory factor
VIAMTITIDQLNDDCTIKFDGDLTIYQVAEYQKQLVEKCDLVVSATVQLGVEVELDTAGIQLLISFQKQLQAAGGDLTVQTTGEQSTQVIEVFNLSSQFNLADRGH